MTRLFDILKTYAKENNIKVIIVQSVLTYEMSSWCLKNGFHPIESTGCNNWVFKDFLGGNSEPVEIFQGDYRYLLTT